MSKATPDSSFPDQPKPTPEEVETIMAQADGVLGAAGHSVTDPAARDVIRQHIIGEISEEEARRRIVEDTLGYVPASMDDGR